MTDSTILSSPFFKHEVIDRALEQAQSAEQPPCPPQRQLGLLAAKIRLLDDDLATSATASAAAAAAAVATTAQGSLEQTSKRNETLVKLMETKLTFALALWKDVQVKQAEGEAVKLLELSKSLSRAGSSTGIQNVKIKDPLMTTPDDSTSKPPPMDHTVCQDTVQLIAKHVQLRTLTLLEEIDESLGKAGRVKRWREQRARLMG